MPPSAQKGVSAPQVIHIVAHRIQNHQSGFAPNRCLNDGASTSFRVIVPREWESRAADQSPAHVIRIYAVNPLNFGGLWRH